MANGDTAVQHHIVSISVDLGVTTPDNLRHIEFGLEKDTGDDESFSWTIHFNSRNGRAVQMISSMWLHSI